MTCEEIKICLHDYVDEQLDLVTKNEVKNHLLGCDLCFKEYKRIQDFFELLKALPYTLEPTEDIVEEFSRELLNQSRKDDAADFAISAADKKRIQKEQRKQEAILKAGWSVNKKSRASKTIMGAVRANKHHASNQKWKRALILPVVFIVLAAAYFVYDLQKRNSPWNFEIVSGSVTINGKQLASGSLFEEEVLRTNANSHAVLFVPQTGKIELLPNTNIVIKNAMNGDNIIGINKGSINVIGSVDMPDISLEFSASLISNMSGTFNFNANSDGNALLTVETGFVEINFGEEKDYVKAGYVCKLKRGGMPGVPCRVDAQNSFKKIVEKYNVARDDETIADSVISSASKDDMLTLLAMIPRATQLQRQIIFQEIANHFPPPVNVTRLGILRADQNMIYEWWEDIEWQL